MKQGKKRGVGKAESAPDPQSMERREVSKLIAALALFGTGLGVNLEEAFAGLTQPVVPQTEKPGADFAKHTTPEAVAGKVEQPSADHTKLPQPSVDLHKSVPTGVQPEGQALPAVQRHKNLPSVDHDKWTPTATPSGQVLRPGVNRAKPVPANVPQKSLIQGE